jgi:hypothetical protein
MRSWQSIALTLPFTLMALAKLTPEQFRALCNERGYIFAQLATLWNLSLGRISQIVGDAERPAHFDYAHWSLPPRLQAKAVTQRRASVLAELRTCTRKPAKPVFDADAHWLEVTQIGMGFTSSAEFSENIPDGALGVVIARTSNTNNPEVSIQFETGFVEVFPLDYLKAIDCPLWSMLRKVIV